MRSYVYPKLMRAELRRIYVTNPDLRSEAVERALLDTDLDTLARQGLRRARQTPKVDYEPFSLALSDKAIAVLRALPASTSRSALIQWILSK